MITPHRLQHLMCLYCRLQKNHQWLDLNIQATSQIRFPAGTLPMWSSLFLVLVAVDHQKLIDPALSFI
ncbi:unnamed protein product [Victoria cruziana]